MNSVLKVSCGPSLRRSMSTLQIKLQKKLPFRQLDGSVDRNSSDYEEARKSSDATLQHLKVYLEKMKAGGGARSIKRHVEVNKKLLPWRRVEELLDDDSEFLNICNLAGFGMDYGDIPGAGYILGVGKVFNRFCLICANDSTVKSGAAYPITVTKHLRAQQIALENHLPCIYLVDSAGAFLPLQSEVFPDRHHGGRVFYNEAIMSSQKIPQIAVVCGSCTAGGAYVPTMCDEAVMVKKIGTIFLGGPPLVKAATGEIITEEELGGADLHCRVSGCTDYYAETETAAYESCRDIIATLGIDEITEPGKYEEPLFNSNDLDVLAALKVIKRENVIQILARLLDGSRFHEFKQMYGPSIITGFGNVYGKLVGIISNIGPLNCEAAQAGAHFILMCNQRNIPLVFLQNSAPHSEDQHAYDPAVIKDRAKMISALSATEIPKITINIGGCFGDDNYTMCGRSFNPNFMFSWPGAEVSMSWENADKEINLNENPFNRSTSAFYSCSRVLNDGIIYPKDTRKHLGMCLQIVCSRPINDQPRLPIIRM